MFRRTINYCTPANERIPEDFGGDARAEAVQLAPFSDLRRYSPTIMPLALPSLRWAPAHWRRSSLR